MVGVLYRCMYLGCPKRWRYRPIKKVLEKHMIVKHGDIIDITNMTTLRKAVYLLLSFIDLQYKRAV